MIQHYLIIINVACRSDGSERATRGHSEYLLCSFPLFFSWRDDPDWVWGARVHLLITQRFAL